MQLHKVIEIIFSMIILLFLAFLVMGILIAITVMQELSNLEISFSIRVLFVAGMATVYLFIVHLIVKRIRDYNRYI